MKWSAILTSALALLVVPVSCDSFEAEHSYCANERSVGFVITSPWTNVHGKNYTWVATRSTSRGYYKPAGKRCLNGGITDGCVTIPDLIDYSGLVRSAHPVSIIKNCFPFEDGTEVCGAETGIRVNGKFYDTGMPMTTVSVDCNAKCRADWSSDPSTIDICAYSNDKKGEYLGELISQGSEIKNGRVKERTNAYEHCQVNTWKDDIQPWK